MASEDPVLEQAAPAPKAKPELYKIHNMVREISTRTLRMKAPVHHRFVQRFGGGQITVRRTRPATVSKAVLLRHLLEIQKAVNEGRVVIKTMMGEVVDLDTFASKAAANTASPPPRPPLDSAANDKTFEYGVGEKKELFEGGGAPGDTPPLNVQHPLSSDDTPIQTRGADPVRARAAAAQQPKNDDLLLAGIGGEKQDPDEGLGEDDPTLPDAIPAQDGDSETNPGSKRARDKRAKKDGAK